MIARQCYYLVQKTILICLSINELHTCRERGRAGPRECMRYTNFLLAVPQTQARSSIRARRS